MLIHRLVKDCSRIVVLVVIIVAVVFFIIEPFKVYLVIVVIEKNAVLIEDVIKPTVTKRECVVGRQSMYIFVAAVKERDSLRKDKFTIRFLFTGLRIVEKSEIVFAGSQFALRVLEVLLQIFFKYRPQSVLFGTVNIKFFFKVKSVKSGHSAFSPCRPKNILNFFKNRSQLRKK